MKYTRIFTGPDGNSHFEDIDVPLKDTPRGNQGPTMKATGVFFRITGTDYDLDFHNPNNRQFVITLEGQVDVTASDGTTRRFGPGDIMLADDITGKGHLSKAVGNKPRRAVFVTID